MFENTYKKIELIGVSKISWEEAAKNAIELSAKKILDMSIAEVVQLDLMIDDAKVSTYRARLTVSFKYLDEKWFI